MDNIIGQCTRHVAKKDMGSVLSADGNFSAASSSERQENRVVEWE